MFVYGECGVSQDTFRSPDCHDQMRCPTCSDPAARATSVSLPAKQDTRAAAELVREGGLALEGLLADRAIATTRRAILEPILVEDH